MNEIKEVRVWALAGLILGLPVSFVINQLISSYLLKETLSWPGIVGGYLGAAAWSLVAIANPRPFTRTAARERRKELRRNWVPWLVVGIFIGVILTVWAVGVLVSLYL